MRGTVQSVCDNDSAPAQRYLPIATETLHAEGTYPFDVFRRTSRTSVSLFRHRETPIGRNDLERLHEGGTKALYIRFADRELYSQYLQDRLVATDQQPWTESYGLLKRATRTLFETALHTDCVADSIGIANQYGRQLTDVLFRRDLVLRDLFSLMMHDYYTFTHATNVCTYSLAIAAKLGISDQNELVSMAVGALLHDIGKRYVSHHVLNKVEPLTFDERETIQAHAQWGFEALCLQEGISWGQLMMVYQHHERLDGRGYPCNLVASDIHDWAKICAVADVFDALTCDRPHRAAISTAEAFEFFERRAGVSFDREVVRCLIASMSGK